MLVLDPSRRYTIEQIKHHRWMMTERAIAMGSTSDISSKATNLEPNEQILRLMVGLGIDSQKTRESLKVIWYLFVLKIQINWKFHFLFLFI